MSDYVEIVKKKIKSGETTQTKIAKGANINPGALSSWLNHKYLGDCDAIEASIKNYFSDDLVEDKIQKSKNALNLNISWQPTETAKRILFALEFANKYKQFTFVCTGPGMGKTMNVKKYSQESDNVYLATMTGSERTTKKVLRQIAESLGATGKLSEDDSKDYIKDKLVKTGGHLIVDEAQHLKAECIEVIRGFYDDARENYDGMGLTLSGNIGVHQTISGGNGKYDYGQIFSRIPLNVVRHKATNDDMNLLLQAWGIHDKKSADFLKKIGNRTGALRGMHNNLMLANLIADGAGKPLSLDHIRQAEANNAFSK